MHLNSGLLFEKYARPYFTDGVKVLEIGPEGDLGYKRFLPDSDIGWETADITPSPRLTYIVKNEYAFPIPDNKFDIVLSGQVIEHVKKPWVWIRELARVARKGGRVITIAPASWKYHEAPVDCWRVYAEGMKALYEEAGLDIELCVTESLEVTGYKRLLPGQSVRPGRGNFKLILRKLFGLPVMCAFDTIAIGIKK